MPIDVKAGGKRSDQIESTPKVGQRFESENLIDLAFDLEQLNEITEETVFASIKPQTAMAKPLANKQKEPPAAANVENRQRR